MGLTAQAAVPARTASATGPASGTTGTTPAGNSRNVSPRIGNNFDTSVRRLPGITVSTSASGAMPCVARNRAPSPVSAPLSSTGWPTKVAGRPCLAKNEGSNGSRHSSASHRPG